MEPDAIESEEKHYVKMEGAYRKVIQDPALPDECKKGLEIALNFCQKKRYKKSK